MSDILVGILGLVCIVAIVVTLFKSKTQPAIAFIVFPAVLGLIMVIGIGQAFGVDALPIAVAMVVCRNCATFISPMVPATLLGTGLAEVDIKDHIKASFLYVWGFSILCMFVAILFGIMPL